MPSSKCSRRRRPLPKWSIAQTILWRRATPLLLDQLQRTPAQFEAIAEDIRGFFGRSATPPTPDDLIFAGTVLSVMQRNPIRDSYNIFSANGLTHVGPADAVLLSLAVEPSSILRHRKLGYHIHILRHHQTAAGPAVKAWLAESFEPVRRSVDDIKRDYLTLIDKHRAHDRRAGDHPQPHVDLRL